MKCSGCQCELPFTEEEMEADQKAFEAEVAPGKKGCVVSFLLCETCADKFKKGTFDKFKLEAFGKRARENLN